MTSPTPVITGASHVALTVRDMEASARWYQQVLGLVLLRQLSEDEAGTPRVLLIHPGSLFGIALCEPHDGTGDAFDHRTTGLDHFAFLVADESELKRWASHLTEQGVAVSPVRDVSGLGRFISFEDPDGIQFELWANARVQRTS